MLRRKRLTVSLCALAIFVLAGRARSKDETNQLAREILKQLIEINTTDSVGNVTTAAEAMAKRLRDALRVSNFCKEEGLNLNVRASIGLATYPHDAKSPHDVIRQADEMMYLVKNTTRDNIGIAQRGVMK